MENKKLLKFLLKDLSELDELFAEKTDNVFVDLEMEFLQARVKGAKKLAQILSIRLMELEPPEIERLLTEKDNEVKIEKLAPEITVEKDQEDIVAENPGLEEEVYGDKTTFNDVPVFQEEEIMEELKEVPVYEDEQEIELEDEEIIDDGNRRIGDRLLTEKSVNDLMSADPSSLEHKISNRPVPNIQASIGINDRFQYIRELFDGSADTFGTTVSELDKMSNINEAVKYLQQNFKWKKNETSLKFINLVKRRFLND